MGLYENVENTYNNTNFSRLIFNKILIINIDKCGMKY